MIGNYYRRAIIKKEQPHISPVLYNLGKLAYLFRFKTYTFNIVFDFFSLLKRSNLAPLLNDSITYDTT